METGNFLWKWGLCVAHQSLQFHQYIPNFNQINQKLKFQRWQVSKNVMKINCEKEVKEKVWVQSSSHLYDPQALLSAFMFYISCDLCCLLSSQTANVYGREMEVLWKIGQGWGIGGSEKLRRLVWKGPWGHKTHLMVQWELWLVWQGGKSLLVAVYKHVADTRALWYQGSWINRSSLAVLSG